jgi:hypothetical protein
VNTETEAAFRITPGRKAAKAVRQAVRSGDTDSLQQLFLKHLRKPGRKLPVTSAVDLLSFWSVDDADLNGRERELAVAIEQMPQRPRAGVKRRAVRQREFREHLKALVAAWLNDRPDDCGPWESIAVAELLIRHGGTLPSEMFCEVLSTLARQLPELARVSPEDGSHELLDRLLQAEAGLLLSYLLEPFKLQHSVKEFAHGVQAAWNHAVDDKGMWQASVFDTAPAWLSSFTRCHIWCHAFDSSWQGAKQRTQWTRCIRRTIGQLTARGTYLSESSATPASGERTLDVLKASIRFSTLSPSGKFGQLLKQVVRIRHSSRPLPRAFSVMPKKPARKSQLPAWQSDDTDSAVIRTSTQPFADIATAWWHDSQVNVAIAAAGIPAFRGQWTWNCSVGGKPVAAPESWRASCWYRDPEVVILELTGFADESVKVIRHIVVSMPSQFAVLTDSVTTQSADQSVTLESTLPTVRDTTISTDPITPELMLSPDKRRQVRAIPAWMEDDRVRGSHGTFTHTDDHLHMAASGQGGIVVPLVLDWNEKRANAVADWNRLTICEGGRVVQPHEAGAYRVRAGRLQLVIYRSLMIPEIPRSVLGMHTGEESIYAQVVSGDPPKCLVEVESPAKANSEKSGQEEPSE